MTENSADKKPNKDYLDGYQNIEKQINDKLIKYLKALDFPENDMGFHMIIYNFVTQWGNGDTEAEDLYNNFNKIIEGLATEFKNQIHEKTSSEILEALIERAKRMDILINFLTKTFSFLDFYFSKFRKCPNLFASALSIYRKVLFEPFKEEVTIEVNKLLKEDREGKHEHRNIIKKILSIMKTMDLNNPKIVKEKDASIWIEDTAPKEVNNEEKKEQEKISIQNFWFEKFKQDTEQFVVNKAKKIFKIDQLLNMF